MKTATKGTALIHNGNQRGCKPILVHSIGVNTNDAILHSIGVKTNSAIHRNTDPWSSLCLCLCPQKKLLRPTGKWPDQRGIVEDINSQCLVCNSIKWEQTAAILFFHGSCSSDQLTMENKTDTDKRENRRAWLLPTQQGNCST